MGEMILNRSFEHSHPSTYNKCGYAQLVSNAWIVTFWQDRSVQKLSFPSTCDVMWFWCSWIHGLCPAYLSPLLQQYCPQRNLRSSSKLLFTVPTVNSVTYGERAFSFSAPKLWNTLPNSVKNAPSLSTFKSALKTFLFRKFYCWFIFIFSRRT